MASFGTIYSYPNNPRVIKAQAAANLNNLTLTTAPFTMGETNKTPSFLSKFPFGKVPAFESADGSLHLVESNAITQYVAESGPAAPQLLGASSAERALVRQWVDFADGEVLAPVLSLGLWRLGIHSYKYDEATETAALGRIERSLAFVESQFTGEKEGRKWLVEGTENVSLADISVAAALIWGFAISLDKEVREKFPAVMAWYERVTETEGVKEAFGEKKFVEKRLAPPSA